MNTINCAPSSTSRPVILDDTNKLISLCYFVREMKCAKRDCKTKEEKRACSILADRDMTLVVKDGSVLSDCSPSVSSVRQEANRKQSGAGFTSYVKILK